MPGRTIENGYDKEHRKLRAEYAQRMAAGEQFDCWRCGRPIGPAANWDLGHDDADRSIHRGPEHTYCNRSRGRRRATASRRHSSNTPRVCEICGTEYRPAHHRQRTCGRVCGAELRRRNAPPKPKKKPRQYERVCSECSTPFTTTYTHKLTCGETCSQARERRLERERAKRRPRKYRPLVSGWDRLLQKNRGAA